MGDLRTARARDRHRCTLGALLPLALLAACGDGSRGRPAAPSRPVAPEAPAAAPAKSTAKAAARPRAPAPPPADASPGRPSPAAEAQAVSRPVPGEPPDFTALKVRVVAGDNSVRMMKLLQKVGAKHPKNEAIPYLLGQLYFEKLWVGDGIKSFRRALQLDPGLRENPYIIRSAINGLGNDRDYGQVRRFLIDDIGRPAGRYLADALYEDWREQVKERIVAILRELQ